MVKWLERGRHCLMSIMARISTFTKCRANTPTQATFYAILYQYLQSIALHKAVAGAQMKHTVERSRYPPEETKKKRTPDMFCCLREFYQYVYTCKYHVSLEYSKKNHQLFLPLYHNAMFDLTVPPHFSLGRLELSPGSASTQKISLLERCSSRQGKRFQRKQALVLRRRQCIQLIPAQQVHGTLVVHSKQCCEPSAHKSSHLYQAYTLKCHRSDRGSPMEHGECHEQSTELLSCSPQVAIH